MATIGVTLVVARVWASFNIWKPLRTVLEYIRDDSNAIGAALNVALVMGLAAVVILLVMG